MIDALRLAMGALKPAPRSPWQRSKGKRKKKHLIDQHHTAHVSAKVELSALRPAGCYRVERDGVLTHRIVAGDDGKWAVSCVGRNGISNRYDSAELAAKRYGLIVHRWA